MRVEANLALSLFLEYSPYIRYKCIRKHEFPEQVREFPSDRRVMRIE